MRDIMLYGNPVLREKAVPVANIDDGIRQLVGEMLETMYANNGVGLAAQQVGRNERMCVVDVSPVREPDDEHNPADADDGVPMPLVMINPRMVDQGGEQTGDEGCLSFPEISFPIKRAAELTAVFTDADGNEQTVRCTGLLARAIQHELDHLNGVLLVDRMSAAQKIAVAGRLKRLRKRGRFQ